MSRITALSEWLLRRSAVWGSLACFAFHVLVVKNAPHDGRLYNWFAGEGAPLKSTISLLLFVGSAALLMRLFHLVLQLGAIERCTLSQAPADGQTPDDVDGLLSELDQCPRSLTGSYILNRMVAALNYVKHAGTADSLTGHLSQLSEVDRRALPQNYSGIRTISLCVPFVGLLGVAAGGASALSAIAAGDQAAALAGGQLATEVIALAIGASIGLLTLRLGVERVELGLLSAVDREVGQQLLGRFRHYGNVADPRTASIVRLCEKVLETVSASVAQHDATLTKALSIASRRWEETASTAAALLHRTVGDALTSGLKEHADALNRGVVKHTEDLHGVLLRHAQILSENVDDHTGALADALEHHTAVITQTETNLAAENRRHLAELEAALGEAVLVASTRQEKLIQHSEQLLREMQTSLVESAGVAVAQQQQLNRQGEVLLKVVEATGQLRRLEEALNSNLSSLAGAHHFEETVVGLSAALQMMSAQLGRPASPRDEISFSGDHRTSRAA